MAKLCPRGKAAAKRKFDVYPSAYANMYASAVCSGKVKPGGKKKRNDEAKGKHAAQRFRMMIRKGIRPDDTTARKAAKFNMKNKGMSFKDTDAEMNPDEK